MERNNMQQIDYETAGPGKKLANGFNKIMRGLSFHEHEVATTKHHVGDKVAMAYP